MKSKMSVLRLAALALALTLTQPAFSADFLEPAKPMGRIQKEIAKQSISTGGDLVDFELFDGVSTAIKYKLESEPSYVDGYYTRVDTYKLNIGINPGDMIEDNDSPIGFGIGQETEITFARQFKSQSESLLSLPYTFKNLPLNAEKALKLNTGDFVSMQANLNLVLSAGNATELTGSFGLEGSAYVFVSGDFLVHIYKVDADHVRVKLIAGNKNGRGLSAEVDGDKLKIFGVRLLDRRIENIINLKPFLLRGGKDRGQLFMLDYVFDLRNPQAADLYTKMMTQKTKIKNASTLNPLNNLPELKDLLLNDMTNIESLVKEDANLPFENRRILSVFKGTNTSVGTSSKFRLGFNILRVDKNKSESQNRIVAQDKTDTEHHFILNSHSRRTETRALFKVYGAKIENTFNALYTSNANWVPTNLVGIQIAQDNKQRNLDIKDVVTFQARLKRILPLSVYYKIDWKGFNRLRDSKVNGYFRDRVYFQPRAIELIPSLSAGAFAMELQKYINYTETLVDFDARFAKQDDDPTVRVLRVAELLEVAFNKSLSLRERQASLLKLKDDKLFREVGAGFLISLLPERELESLIYFDLIVSAKSMDVVQFNYGTFAESELYRSLMYIQDLINNRSFDLRLHNPEGTAAAFNN